MEVSDFLSDLSGKQIALFGTCGMGDSPEYYKDIAGRVSAWIEADNDYLGYFICQGKMPQKVRMKYESMRTDENNDQIDRFIQNFDLALTHPDDLDVEHAKVFVDHMLKERFNYNEIIYERLPPAAFLVFFNKKHPEIKYSGCFYKRRQPDLNW